MVLWLRTPQFRLAFGKYTPDTHQITLLVCKHCSKSPPSTASTHLPPFLIRSFNWSSNIHICLCITSQSFSDEDELHIIDLRPISRAVQDRVHKPVATFGRCLCLLCTAAFVKQQPTRFPHIESSSLPSHPLLPPFHIQSKFHPYRCPCWVLLHRSFLLISVPPLRDSFRHQFFTQDVKSSLFSHSLHVSGMRCISHCIFSIRIIRKLF